MITKWLLLSWFAIGLTISDLSAMEGGDEAQEPFKLGHRHKIWDVEAYKKSLETISATVKHLEDYLFVQTSASQSPPLYDWPELNWRCILSEILSSENIAKIFGRCAPEHIMNFAFFHNKYSEYLGLGVYGDKGESITVDLYPDTPHPTVLENDISKSLYDKIAETQKTSEGNIQNQLPPLWDMALKGSPQAQRFLLQILREEKSRAQCRHPFFKEGQYSIDGITILFKALNHFLVYQ